MTKHEAMIAYLKTSPAYADIACQFGKVQDGAVIFNTLQGEKTVSEDILGNKTKYYDFAISTYRALNDDAPSALNLEVLTAADSMMRWIDEQNKAKNFPAFENARVIRIENLQNMPGFAGSDEKQNLVKYMWQVRVTYKTKEE